MFDTLMIVTLATGLTLFQLWAIDRALSHRRP